MDYVRAKQILVSGQGVREGVALGLFRMRIGSTREVKEASLASLVSRFDGWHPEPAARRRLMVAALVRALVQAGETVRVLDDIERKRFSIEGNDSLSVTISIGIAGGMGQQIRMETLVRDADAAMYSAKSLGRNQTYIFAEPDEDARVPRAPISAAGRMRAIEIGMAGNDEHPAHDAGSIRPRGISPHQRRQFSVAGLERRELSHLWNARNVAPKLPVELRAWKLGRRTGQWDRAGRLVRRAGRWLLAGAERC